MISETLFTISNDTKGACAMAYATKKLDPFGARMLSIRLLQQKKAPPSATAVTDACCPSRDVEYVEVVEEDDLDPLGCDEPTFDVGGVSTGCNDCGHGLDAEAEKMNADHLHMSSQLAVNLNGIMDVVATLKATVEDQQTRLAAVTTRVNELEMREDALVKSLMDNNALPGFRDLGA